MASDKTNVMRVLEQHKIAYKPHETPIRYSRRWLHVANRAAFMYSLFRSQRSLT